MELPPPRTEFAFNLSKKFPFTLLGEVALIEIALLAVAVVGGVLNVHPV